MPYKIKRYMYIEEDDPVIYEKFEEAVVALEQMGFLQPENHYELIEYHNDSIDGEVDETLLAWAPAKDKINF